MATAYDVIKDALTLCGAQQIGEAPEAAVAEMAKTALNDMRAQWSTEGINCFTESSLDITATGATSYLFGTGVGAVAVRPQNIARVYYIIGQSVQLVSPASFDDIKGAPTIAGTPNFWAWDGALEAHLYLHPAPTTGTIRVITPTALGQIALLSDTITDPPENNEATKYGLAIRCANLLGLEISQAVASLATTAYNRLRNQIASRRISRLRTDLPTANKAGFNIYTGGYNSVSG